MPLVLGDRVAFDSVGNVAFAHTDNHASGRIAADHLIERGYRKFACIAGPVEQLLLQEDDWKDSLGRTAGTRLYRTGFTCFFV